MCSDHRLTPSDGQAEINDFSLKQIIVRSADDEALIAYTGMGTIEDDVHVSEWLGRMLRNENWNLDKVLTLIRDWATAKWGPTSCTHERRHWFVVGGFSHGRPLAAEVTNVQGPPRAWPLPHFEIKLYPADTAPQLLVRGAGQEAIGVEDWALLDRITYRQPKRAMNWMRVLAGVHRRAQQSGLLGLLGSETISEACMTMSMPPNYGTPETGEFEHMFHWSGSDAASGRSLPPVPLLVKGLDVTAAYDATPLISSFLEAGQVPPRRCWTAGVKRSNGAWLRPRTLEDRG